MDTEIKDYPAGITPRERPMDDQELYATGKRIAESYLLRLYYPDLVNDLAWSLQEVRQQRVDKRASEERRVEAVGKLEEVVAELPVGQRAKVQAALDVLKAGKERVSGQDR